VNDEKKKWALALLFWACLHADAWLQPARTHLRTPAAPYKSSTTTSLLGPHILNSAKKDKNDQDRQHLEEDIVKRFHASKENVKRGKPKKGEHKSLVDDIAKRLDLSTTNKDEALSVSALDSQKQTTRMKNTKRTTIKRNRTGLLPPPPASSASFSEPKKTSNAPSSSSFSSLLPPPLPSLKSEESLSGELSSWEEFLGRADSESNSEDNKRLLPKPKGQTKKEKQDDNLQLPSITDLFPSESNKKESSRSSFSSLDGVLPVSELFYRSSQALVSGEEEEGKKKMEEEEEGDDEELPFSAEQSDQLETDGNKVNIRRNRASVRPKTTTSPNKAPKKKNRGRKLVRRGMEMFLGGTPINADPPQRSVELTYRVPQEGDDWKSAITLNTKDFGPLLHTDSADSLSRVELGLYCEHFVNAAMKWNVCPKDLKEIVKNHMLQQNSSTKLQTTTQVLLDPTDSQPMTTNNSSSASSSSSVTIEMQNGADTTPPEMAAQDKQKSLFLKKAEEEEDDSILSLLRNINDGDDINTSAQAPKLNSGKYSQEERNTAPKGFGTKPGKKSHVGPKNVAEQRWRMVGFALKFSIGVSKSELVGRDSGGAGTTMRAVLTRGITTVLKSKLDGLTVRINKLKLKEDDEGATTVRIEFSLDGKGDVTQDDVEKRAARIDTALLEAMDDGDFALALAAASREETAWTQEVRDRVVEEFLMEDDDVGPWEDPEPKKGVNGSQTKKLAETLSSPKQEAEDNEKGPFGAPYSPAYADDDLFLGGGNGGVFFDYSESNAANAPFKGDLGPLLVDAVTAYCAEQRRPHVIAIGDVHGCIDELQDLLRLCDYRPGDLVVFLGDLVSKGPDSIAVVQMAREIGAIAVRGNHDFEVIRWHQAIKSGTKDASRVSSCG
jgi:hypothetical protein